MTKKTDHRAGQPVRRLRAVHVSAALCLVGIFALAPFARDWPSLHAGAAVAGPKRGAEILLALTLLLALVSLALACLPSMSDRPGSEVITAGTGPIVEDTPRTGRAAG